MFALDPPPEPPTAPAALLAPPPPPPPIEVIPNAFQMQNYLLHYFL
jgi:hypothetical protein